MTFDKKCLLVSCYFYFVNNNMKYLKIFNKPILSTQPLAEEK